MVARRWLCGLVAIISCQQWSVSQHVCCSHDTTLLPYVYNDNAFSGKSFLSVQTRGMLVCVKQCMLRNRCMSISYDTNTGLCQLNDARDEQEIVQRKGTVFTMAKYWPIRMAGHCALHDCSKESYCAEKYPESYICVKELNTANRSRTACEIGFHLSKRQNICTKKCNVYGRSFIGYRNYGITGHNYRSLHRPTSLFRCRMECFHLNSSNPCILFEYHSIWKVCLLSVLDWFDVSPKFRSTNDKGYVLYARQCFP